MKPIISAAFEWLRNHSHAILGTIVLLQNSGMISQELAKPLSVLREIFSALGG